MPRTSSFPISFHDDTHQATVAITDNQSRRSGDPKRIRHCILTSPRFNGLSRNIARHAFGKRSWTFSRRSTFTTTSPRAVGFRCPFPIFKYRTPAPFLFRYTQTRRKLSSRNVSVRIIIPRYTVPRRFSISTKSALSTSKFLRNGRLPSLLLLPTWGRKSVY